MPQTRNEATSTSRAAAAPAVATVRPASTGPITKVPEKTTLTTALACCSARFGSSPTSSSRLAAAASSVRSSAFAASAAVPSTATSSRIAGSEKWDSTTATAPIVRAST